MVRVVRTAPRSIAEQVGIGPGTELLTVNGRELADFLDWEFQAADDELVIEAREPNGTRVVYEIERPDGESLGIELEPPSIRRCANRCEFCFIEGLPKGLRRSLYVRDDDYRLSFAYGNFATLSNLKERDFARIIEYRLSPLYVSVHATPPEVRRALLNNPRVPDVIEQLTRLARQGIRFHCQMVIVPGVNDGAVLERSLADLWSLDDAVLSVAVVPVGLTQFSHLYTGRPMDLATAGRLLDALARWAERGLRERGTPWVLGSDELYLLGDRALPDVAYYGDLPQIENGVGAVAALRARVRAEVGSLPRLDGVRIGVVTGASMGPLMPDLLAQLAASTGAHFELIVATNSLFGPTTTTAGLLCSADVKRVLDGRRALDVALIPAECLNQDGLFLDDEAFDDVRRAMPIPVHASYDFIDVLARDGGGALQRLGGSATAR